jgi:serine/threonine protein kinase
VIDGVLGHGGMGVVYHATHKALGREVAVKMVLSAYLPPEDRERFAAEAEAAAQLQHPNIVQIYEIGEVGGRPYFSLEYVDGGSLDQRVGGKSTDAYEAAELVAKLARAVHAAHSHGIVHRDLKPANVLLTADGTPKITDFGIAKRLDAATQTQTGKILGTPCYMSPEQAQGGKEVGPSTDIYALGAILYDLLTGRPPFVGGTTLETMLQTVHSEPVSPRTLQPKLPRDLEVICLKCLEKSPARRYESALDLAEDLERLLRNEPVRARPISPLEWIWRWARRNPAAAGMLGMSALALLSLIGSGVWFTGELQRELLATELARNEATQAQRDLRLRLIRSTAESIDADLRQLASVPHVLADALALRSDWSEAQLESWLRAELGHHRHIFGMAVAFEPGGFRDGVDEFALYVYRGPQGIAVKQLLPPEYTPLYRQWPWYRDAQMSARWSEPYVDEGGGEIPMVTFSTPIRRDGRWIGVVTADLSLEYFNSLERAMQGSKLGGSAYAYVITAQGTVLRHPETRLRFPAPASQLPPPAAPELRRIWARILAGGTGTEHGRDPTTDQAGELLFAPIVSTGWSCVGVVPD